MRKNTYNIIVLLTIILFFTGCGPTVYTHSVTHSIIEDYKDEDAKALTGDSYYYITTLLQLDEKRSNLNLSHNDLRHFYHIYATAQDAKDRGYNYLSIIFPKRMSQTKMEVNNSNVNEFLKFVHSHTESFSKKLYHNKYIDEYGKEEILSYHLIWAVNLNKIQPLNYFSYSISELLEKLEKYGFDESIINIQNVPVRINRKKYEKAEYVTYTEAVLPKINNKGK